MVVVAGPAGSGKTTLFPVTAFGIDAFSIDDRCAQLQGSYTAISKATRSAVAQECEAFVLRHIAEKRSFAVETTLRTHIAVKQASFARKHGFLTVLRYVATSDIEENVARVTMRALGGGHGAPRQARSETFIEQASATCWSLFRLSSWRRSSTQPSDGPNPDSCARSATGS